MADRLPLKLQDIGNGEGRLREFEPGDKMPVGVIPTDGLLEHLGLSESGKTVATGTPEQGRAALQLKGAALVDVVGSMASGAIIEAGDNANGSYVKFADGSLVCHRFELPISQVSTGVMEATWTYPHIFSGGGPHWLGVTLGSGLAFAQCVGLPNARDVGANFAVVGFRSPSNTHTPGTSAVVRVSAIGRWE